MSSSEDREEGTMECGIHEKPQLSVDGRIMEGLAVVSIPGDGVDNAVFYNPVRGLVVLSGVCDVGWESHQPPPMSMFG